jgi:hypothetical protein
MPRPSCSFRDVDRNPQPDGDGHYDGTPHRACGIIVSQTPDMVLMFQPQA